MRLLVTLILIAAAYCGLAWDQIPFLVDDSPAPSKTQAAAPPPPTRVLPANRADDDNARFEANAAAQPKAPVPTNAESPAKPADHNAIAPWTAFADARALAEAQMLRGYGENR